MLEHFWSWIDYAELIKLQQKGVKYRLEKRIPTVLKINHYRGQAKPKNISTPNTVRCLRIGKK